MKRLTFFIFAGLISLFLLAACGGSEPEPAETANNSIDVVMNDIYYGDDAANPPTWTVDSGTNIRLKIQNNGALEHNFAVVRPGESIPDTYNPETDSGILLQEAGLSAAGESRNETLQSFDPGTYTVICTVVGHWPAMQGTLVVE